MFCSQNNCMEAQLAEQPSHRGGRKRMLFKYRALVEWRRCVTGGVRVASRSNRGCGPTILRMLGKYRDSRRAEQALAECFQVGPGGNRIRARTARRWMKKMGFSYDEVKKGVYVDGHEREDVIRYKAQ